MLTRVLLCRYDDLSTLLSFDEAELLEILTEDLGLTLIEARRFAVGAPEEVF